METELKPRRFRWRESISAWFNFANSSRAYGPWGGKLSTCLVIVFVNVVYFSEQKCKNRKFGIRKTRNKKQFFVFKIKNRALIEGMLYFMPYCNVHISSVGRKDSSGAFSLLFVPQSFSFFLTPNKSVSIINHSIGEERRKLPLPYCSRRV